MESARIAGRSFSPLDEELQLLPGSLTPPLHEVLVRLGAWMPFGSAQEMLVDFMKLNSLSEATVRRRTEAAGAAYVACQEQAVTKLELGQELSPGVAAQQLVLEVDGAMVPLVGGEWAEVKTLVIGEPAEAADESAAELGALESISSFSRLTDAENFTRMALVETQRRGVEAAERVALVSDGAEWIQGFGDYHCPDGVRILDFPHAAEYLAEIGQGVFGEGASAPNGWLSQQLHRLKHEGASPVLAELRSLIQTQETDLSKPLAYLAKREDQMQYPIFQTQGWPLGSGAVESANKLVVEARLKGGGMHWARCQVNPMLALRNIVCSDRWAEAWPQIASRLREPALPRARTPIEKEGSSAALEAKAQLGSLAEPAVMVKSRTEVEIPNGPPVSKTDHRPAAHHPWRRAPVGRAKYQYLPKATPK